MRIGIFSDVHANIEALTAVLEAFKTRAHRQVRLPRRRRRLRRLAERVLRPDPQDRRVHDPRQPRRRGRRPDGLLVLLRRRPPGARPPRAPAAAGEHGVARGACRTRSARATSRSATARRSTSRSSSTSSRPSRRALPRHLGRPRRRHVHRPLAPVQVVRADPRRGVRGRRDEVRDPARAPLHHHRRLGRPAARLRQPRELHDLRQRREARSSSSASSTTSTRRRRRSSRPSSSATSATASSSASRLALFERARRAKCSRQLARVIELRPCRSSRRGASRAG